MCLVFEEYFWLPNCCLFFIADIMEMTALCLHELIVSGIEIDIISTPFTTLEIYVRAECYAMRR